MPEFTKVDVPRGQFFGWAVKPPQEVTVSVVSFDPQGGRDAKDNVVPRLVGKAIEPTTSYRERGTVEVKIPAGELITIEGGVANVKSGLLAADPKPGDIVQLKFVGTYETKSGTGKEIEVYIARGAANNGVSDEDV